VRVQAVLNQEILGEALADLHRPDLAAAGLGDGRSGYAIKLFRRIDPLYLPFVSVTVDDGDAALPRAPELGFQEFFSALYRQHPIAGRSRSIFGGLWTDRTDAMALLGGKVAIGQVSEAVSAAVLRLIHSGVTILDLIGLPVDEAWQKSLAESVGDLLEDQAVLPVLRSVLDDNPLVVCAAWVHGCETALAQPSTKNFAPSPTECLALLVPFGDSVILDVVRDSHRLPEFTPSGVSRWVQGDAAAGLQIAAGNGLLDRYVLAPGTVALIGPGTLHRLRSGTESAAMRLLCLPARLAPSELATDSRRQEVSRASGVRTWL
jgi:hypothetical protein